MRLAVVKIASLRNDFQRNMTDDGVPKETKKEKKQI